MLNYDKSYAKQLLGGMRGEGKSKIECCLDWNITESNYNAWLDENEDFKYAHEIGEMQCSAYWYNLAKSLAQKGNASVLIAGMKNLERGNWVDKREAAKEAEEPITAIEITVLPPRIEE